MDYKLLSEYPGFTAGMKTWNDGRPEYICKKCGYATCCCHLQRKCVLPKVKRGKGITAGEAESI